MIEVSSRDDAPLHVRQTLAAPAVYLDHWAIRKISEAPDLAERLIEAIRRRSGSVTLSWLNLVEFIRVTDEQQVNAAGDLFARLYPNMFFIEVNPFTVIEAEDRILETGQVIAPYADAELLKGFFLLHPTSFRLHDPVHLFETVREYDGTGQLDSLATTIVERIEALRKQFTQSQEFARTLAQKPALSVKERGTRYVLREVLRQVIIDTSAPLKPNDAIDFMHSVVPVSYCDFVLLDRRWKAMVERAKDPLLSLGAEFELARVGSGRANGTEEFIQALELEA